MKKYVYLLFALFLVLFAAGCGSKASEEDLPADTLAAGAEPTPPTVIDVEIKDKLFITQVDDIYINLGDYLGKTIKLEGVFSSTVYSGNGQTYHFVNRYTPGCCPGVDFFTSGFEVVYDGEYPEEDAWVEAIGVYDRYEEDGYEYFQLVLSSLRTLEERGQEFVQ